MAFFYFFKKDGNCSWMKREMTSEYPKYLSGPVEYKGETRDFYAVLSWVMKDAHGANLEWVKETGLNVVPTVNDLPAEAGVYVTGYDADIEELRQLNDANVPVIDNPCPWIRALRNQLMENDKDTYQYVLMLDPGHMVYDCFKSVFPEDLIPVTNSNYKAQIDTLSNNKPKKFMTYATFRPDEAKAVADHINRAYPHPQNKLDLYKKTLCVWTRQGLLEEIRHTIPELELDSVWVICSSTKDRSTRSILSQVESTGATSRVIHGSADVPRQVAENDRIGVLFAPIPLSRGVREITELIKTRFNTE